MQIQRISLCEDQEWQVHPYSKQQLAMAYAPEITPQSAVNRLMSWIRHNTELYEALLHTGYDRRQRLFNSLQVQLIFQFLGKP